MKHWIFVIGLALSIAAPSSAADAKINKKIAVKKSTAKKAMVKKDAPKQPTSTQNNKFGVK